MTKESKEKMSRVLEELLENFENPQLLVQEIKEQTQQYSGFRLVLIGTIVKNILESRFDNSSIPEQKWIQSLIQEGIINNWIEQAVEKIEQEALDELKSVEDNKEQKPLNKLKSVENNEEQQNSNSLNNQISILPKLLALIVFVIAFVGFPVLFLRNATNTTNTPEQNPPKQTNADLELCQLPIPSSSDEQDNLIKELEALKNKPGENFSKICSEKLYSLQIETVERRAGKSGPITVVEELCKIPKNSDSFEGAQFWIKEWLLHSEDERTSNRVKRYIELSNSCPAADDLAAEETKNL